MSLGAAAERHDTTRGVTLTKAWGSPSGLRSIGSLIAPSAGPEPGNSVHPPRAGITSSNPPKTAVLKVTITPEMLGDAVVG